MNSTRRGLLKASGVVTAGVLAGCIGEDGSEPAAQGNGETESLDGDGGYAAFFTLYDWTQNIAGEHMDIINPVPAGEIGHGWEPTANLQTQVAESDIFIYLDSPEFRWAQDAVESIESEGTDVVTVNALEGIDLLEFDGHDHDHGHDHDDDHHDDDHHDDDHHDDDHDDHHHDDDHDDHHHDDDHDDHHHDDHDDHHHDDHDDHHHDDDHDDHHHDDDHDDHHHDDDHDDHHHDDDHDHDHDHEHGDYDPHVWVDPVLAQTCVDNIADGLAEADPDNADDYYDNAEAYKNELQDLHEQFESALAHKHIDTLVLAGHDSFQYLAERYDFEIHSPQGVSPQDEATTSDIIDSIELVNELGISHVTYDYFESDNLAQQIVAESDAEEVATLTPAEGSTPEWNDDGWGYIEQMEEINLPTLEAALDAH